MESLVYLGCLVVGGLFLMRIIAIQQFKISYYETKLKSRDVDISSVENITLTGIFKS
jgi:hypothetical protein